MSYADFLARNLLPDGGVGPGNAYGFQRRRLA